MVPMIVDFRSRILAIPLLQKTPVKAKNHPENSQGVGVDVDLISSHISHFTKNENENFIQRCPPSYRTRR